MLVKAEESWQTTSYLKGCSYPGKALLEESEQSDNYSEHS